MTSASVSPTKYNRLNSLLSKIDENLEADEPSENRSESPSSDSVSPVSEKGFNLQLSSLKLIGCEKESSNVTFSYNAIRQGIPNKFKNQHPLTLRYDPGTPIDQKFRIPVQKFDDYFASFYTLNDENEYQLKHTHYDVG